MIEAIKQVPDYQTKTAEQIRSYLAEEITLPNQKIYKISTLENLMGSGYFSFAELNQVLGTLQSSPLFNSAYLAMSANDGIELGSPIRQMLIAQMAIAGQWSDSLRDRVLALGKTKLTRWASVGGTGDVPNAEAISAALTPQVADSYSHEVLLSVNRQPDGTMFAVARVTLVGMKDGAVVSRGETQVTINGELATLVEPIVQSLMQNETTP